MKFVRQIRDEWRFNRLGVLLGVAVLLLGEGLLQLNDWKMQRWQEQIAAQAAQVATAVSLGQPVPFSSLGDGHFTVICVADFGNGVAVVRQSIPTDDVDVFIRELPTDLLRPGARYTRRS